MVDVEEGVLWLVGVFIVLILFGFSCIFVWRWLVDLGDGVGVFLEEKDFLKIVEGREL